jgi:hypothetical protein
MPTRLGNALRRHEDRTGQQYGLDVITVAPHLSLTAAADHYEYVIDQRKMLDLALRVCTFSLLATGLTAAFLANDGMWVALALAPYVAAYLAYRGAVSSVDGYATAIATVIDLDRFRLYESLHVALPHKLSQEIRLGNDVVALLSGERPTMRYNHPTNGPNSSVSSTNQSH